MCVCISEKWTNTVKISSDKHEKNNEIHKTLHNNSEIVPN